MRDSILKRFAIVTLVALTLAVAASLALSYLYSWHETLKLGATQTESAADVVSYNLQNLDEDEVFDPDSEVYDEMHGNLRWVCETYNLKYISIYTADEGLTTRTYYYAAADEDEDDKLARQYFPFGATSDTPFDKAEIAALSGKVLSDSPERIKNEYGTTYAWYYPLKMKGYDRYFVICTEFNVRVIVTSVNDNALSFAVPMITILMLVIALEILLLQRDVVRPLRVVSSKMRNFIQDRARDNTPLDFARNDEIGEIAESFNQMSINIENYVDRIQEMTEERVASTTELQVARRIQLGFVPETSREVGPGFEAFAMFRAAREVGGDFYDLFIREDGRICVVIADVSGKGVSAALFMAMCRAMVHEKLKRGVNPAQALNEVNDSLLANNPEGMYVTAFAGVYDPSSGELCFANAGHTKPYVVGRGFIVPDTGIALGLFEDAEILEERIRLAPGEGIMLYTDGATEAASADDKLFGEGRLAEAICDAHDAREAVLALVDSIDAFAAGREQFDDITLLCLFAGEGDVWHWELSPEISSFATLRHGILELCGNTTMVRRAMLALDEAFSNVVNYSGATKVDVWAQREGGTLTVRLVDDGVAFDPLTHEVGERDFEDLDDGGMGIMFIGEAACDLSYERTGGCNVFSMTFELEEH